MPLLAANGVKSAGETTHREQGRAQISQDWNVSGDSSNPRDDIQGACGACAATGRVGAGSVLTALAWRMGSDEVVAGGGVQEGSAGMVNK